MTRPFVRTYSNNNDSTGSDVVLMYRDDFPYIFVIFMCVGGFVRGCVCPSFVLFQFKGHENGNR